MQEATLLAPEPNAHEQPARSVPALTSKDTSNLNSIFKTHAYLKVVPNLVGVDIVCGMETVSLKDKHIDLAALRCAKHVDLNRAELSIGTLGGVPNLY